MVRACSAETNHPEIEQNCPAGMISNGSSGSSVFGRDEPPRTRVNVSEGDDSSRMKAVRVGSTVHKHFSILRI